MASTRMRPVPLRQVLRLALLAAALLPLTPASANELQRIYELARRNDARLAAAGHARDAALEARPQALAALLPQLNASATQNWQRSTVDSVELIDPAQPELGTRALSSTRSSQPYSFTLGAAQPLFDYSALRRYAQAGDLVALAETRYRAAEQDLSLRVAEAYFSLLAADDARRSFEAQRLAFERALEEASRRFEVGVAPITDVQEAQASRDLAAAQELEAQQALDAAREALAEISGEPVTTWAPLRADIALDVPEHGRDEWVRRALDGNFELIIADAEVGLAQDDITIARSAHLPTLNLAAARSLREDDEADSGRQDSGSVALQLSLPLFSGGAVASQVRQATATRAQRESERLGAQRLVERTTRDAYQGVVTGRARVLAYQQAVRSSQTALVASESGLRVGTRRLLDVLNAQQQLSAAQRDFERSRYDYLLALLRLQAATGQLSARALNDLDSLLISPPG